MNGQPPLRITTNRDAAKDDENLALLGLEHPLVKRFLDDDRQLEAPARAWIASTPDGADQKGVLTVWHILLQDADQRFMQRIVPVGLDHQGNRCPRIEQLADSLRNLNPASSSVFTSGDRTKFVSTTIPEMLRRDLAHKGLLSEKVTLAWRLLSWIEVSSHK